MAEPITIPVSYHARSTRHPQTPPQRAFLGVEPMSEIPRLPSPIATPPLPLLVSSATSSKPRRIAITPASATDETPKSPGGSVIQRVSLIAPSAKLRRASDEASPITANSASSTLRAPIRGTTLIPAVHGQVHPLHSSPLAPDLPRRLSDDPPPAFPFPNSLYKLRDRDVPPSAPHSIRGSISSETTIKAGSMARHMNDLRFILREIGSGASSAETARPALLEGVDELMVEWCVRCGKAKGREMMELREVADEDGGGTGVWWVCREECTGPPHNPSREP